MRVMNYSDFRKDLATYLNAVTDDKEIVIVSRTKGKSVVVMDMDDYNSLQETLHLTNSLANRKRLEEAVDEMDRSEFSHHSLIEE